MRAFLFMMFFGGRLTPNLFTPEVGGNFAPSLGVPFDDGVGVGVGLQPSFGSGYKIEDGRVYRIGG